MYSGDLSQMALPDMWLLVPTSSHSSQLFINSNYFGEITAIINIIVE